MVPPRRAILAAIASLVAPAARASFLSGDALDTMADWLAIVVICVVPIGAIILFWLVHILPEKVAEKRHHPQKDAITTLCLLSSSDKYVLLVSGRATALLFMFWR